ncbi:MAG: virulence-associated protein VagC [Lentimonas sp.]|jgi:virulence-associated protein VagC
MRALGFFNCWLVQLLQLEVSPSSRVSLSRRSKNQAVRIPRDFDMAAKEAVDGEYAINRLVLEAGGTPVGPNASSCKDELKLRIMQIRANKL